MINAGTLQVAMYGFAVFYALCLILNWWFYLRRNAYVKNPQATSSTDFHEPFSRSS